MSNSLLIDRLSAELPPVRRRNPARELAVVASLGALELALVLGVGLMRPDMASMIGSPYMIWKLGSLAILALLGCTLAVRSFVPTASSRKGVTMLMVLAVAVTVFGLIAVPHPSEAASLAERLAPAQGLLCAASIVVLSMPVMAALGWLMRRGAPGNPRKSAFACGLAAGTLGALIFAVCCRFNDPLYIVVWYSIGVATVCTAARALLPRRFRL
ncbi:DUF1109 domain-containing protein [Stakelama sp. CBK3Z-3]|uniref:DUF1109 domain-containing protein n=1 Tax=Stakelama flava TaxID=2860338 RepID=A0ABS6XQ46_9SPHN|nr:DUF1109 domain-containing protein [Stakelama flava]MBW4332343.1 DUF1109 domain-containing protein [Stakelama flava]